MRSVLSRFLRAAQLPALTVPICETLLQNLSGEQLMQFADVLSQFAAELQKIRARDAA
jgi:hypothetical protein